MHQPSREVRMDAIASPLPDNARLVQLRDAASERPWEEARAVRRYRDAGGRGESYLV